MGGLREARKNLSRGQSRIDEAGRATEEAFAKAEATYSGVRDEYKPYMETGKVANAALSKLFSDPNAYLDDPMYKAREKRQLDAVETSAAAKGKLFGGQTLLELMKVGGEFASAELDKAAARYSTGAQLGLEAAKGYDQASATLADLQVGGGMAKAKSREDLAASDFARSKFGADMFSSWWSGSGPFGQATGGALSKGCYIAAYHFGHATQEHYLIAKHVHEGKTWKAKLAQIVYAILKPLFNALLKEAKKNA